MHGNHINRPQLFVGAECCLKGSPELLKSAIRGELTIANPKYQAAKRYGRWIGKKLKPTLYFFYEEKDDLIFPRGFANRAVSLCRKITGSGPDIVDKRRKLPDIDISFHGKLRPYQDEAVQAVMQRSFGVLEAGTGSGKTVMALSVIARRRQPTIIIVHSKELLHQWRERIFEFFQMKAGQAGDGAFNLEPVTVAIVNTARNNIEMLPEQFGQIIVDECHRVPASLFTDVVSRFDSHYMLGLSATAFRREDSTTKLIYTYMGDRVHSVNLNVLTDSGAVVKPEIIQRETSFSYFFRGEYSKMIKALAKNKIRNEQICNDIAELVPDTHEGTILVVSDRIAHCEALSDILKSKNIEAAILTGQTSADKRSEIVKDVQNGRIQVLISTVQLIGEGFDCQGLTTLVLATPIKFEGRLLQVVCRIMRPEKCKKALVIDYYDINLPTLRKSANARLQVFNRWDNVIGR